jgi:hypothetical protein
LAWELVFPPESVERMEYTENRGTIKREEQAVTTTGSH